MCMRRGRTGRGRRPALAPIGAPVGGLLVPLRRSLRAENRRSRRRGCRSRTNIPGALAADSYVRAMTAAALVCVGALPACGSGGTVSSAGPMPSTITAAPSAAMPPQRLPRRHPRHPRPRPRGDRQRAIRSARTAMPPAPIRWPCPRSTAARCGSGSIPATTGSCSNCQASDQHAGRVGYSDPLKGDPSGLTVQQRGRAHLGVAVGLWTVNPSEGRPDD